MPGVILLNSCFISKRNDYIQITEPHLRIGVASIAAFLRESGISVTVFDPEVEKLNLEKITQKIISLKPDYLGLPAYTEEINDAARIALEVKKHDPGVVTIIGGPHASAIPHETLEEFKCFDIAVFGEGELTVRDIVKGRELESIDGIAYRNDEGGIVVRNLQRCVDPDTLPPPAWDLYSPKRYQFMPVDTVRGCPYSCIFCFRATGREVRYKSPDRVADEIYRDFTEYGFRRFSLFGGGTFPLGREHGMAVCNRILNKKLRIKWITSTRVGLLDEELLRVMKNSGCELISLGIESGDYEMLKSCNKEITLPQAEKTLKLCKKTGINAELNFILGLPGETKETISATRDFAVRMEKYVSQINFAILTPFPGTQIYKMALDGEGGLKIRTKDWTRYVKQGGYAIEHKNFTHRELDEYQVRFYSSVYLRAPWKIIKLFSFKRAFGLIGKLKSCPN